MKSDDRDATDRRRWPRHLVRVMSEETRSLRPLVRFSTALARLLPDETSGRARVLLLRAAGWRIARTSYLASVPTWSGSGPIRDRLEVGQQCFINLGCHFELSDTVQIGDLVAIGHQVLVLTSTHEIGAAEHRSSTLTTAPVVIEAGSWIGARATILPGVTIGTGAIVAAGAVVTRSVAPNTLVAGIPARQLRELS